MPRQSLGISDPKVIDYLYEQSLDGSDMEAGSSSEGPLWIGGMQLNGDDQEVIEEAGIAPYGDFSYVLISEDSYGFRRAQLYSTREDYYAAFVAYEDEYGDIWYGEEDDD